MPFFCAFQFSIIQIREMLKIEPPDTGVRITQVWQQNFGTRGILETCLVTAEHHGLRKGMIVEVLKLHSSLNGTHRVHRIFRILNKTIFVVVGAQPVEGWKWERKSGKEIPDAPPQACVRALRSIDDNISLYHVIVHNPKMSGKAPDAVTKLKLLHRWKEHLGLDVNSISQDEECAADRMTEEPQAVGAKATGTLFDNKHARREEPHSSAASITPAGQTVAPPAALSRKRNHASLLEGASPTTVAALEFDTKGDGIAAQRLSAQSAEVWTLSCLEKLVQGS